MVLQVSSVSKRFEQLQAVDDVNFSVQAGEAFGLLGPNGAGKSTTINMITGLLRPDAGEVFICGERMSIDAHRTKRHLGYVPQEVALYPDLTAQENLMFWGRLYGLSGPRLRIRVKDVLELVGLSERAKHRVETYSGGMKRRINIAAALLHEPKLLVMDEPTVGIDAQSRSHILDTVKELNHQGLTILYTSHYMEEVELLCDRVAIMDKGSIIAAGTVSELRRIVGEESLITMNLENWREELAEQLLVLPSVSKVLIQGGDLRVTSSNPSLALGSMASLFAEYAVIMRTVQITEPTLETVFLHLTGRALRD
jgi:ABC-2 type transport system ATP-binding protein